MVLLQALLIWAADADKKEESEQVRLAPEAVKRYGISFGLAKKRKITTHLVVPARVAMNTNAMAVVGCPVQGRIVDLKVTAGDVVKKGDVLMVVGSLELGEAQSDYLQKRVATESVRSLVAPNQNAYDRAKKLYEESKGIALTEVEKRQIELEAAKSAVLIAESAVKAAADKLLLMGISQAAIDQLAKSGEINPCYGVYAPIAGTVTESLVTQGELVKPDRERLVVVADLSTLWVLADVPEVRLGEVKVGSKADIRVAAAGERTFSGTVSHIGVAVDPATRTIPVRIEIKSDEVLKPGMFAQADIVSTFRDDDGDESVLCVPAEAVQTVHGTTAVFLAEQGGGGDPNTFTIRLISVGSSAGGFVTIFSGLDGGEKVVTTGSSILKAEVAKSDVPDDDDD